MVTLVHAYMGSVETFKILDWKFYRAYGTQDLVHGRYASKSSPNDKAGPSSFNRSSVGFFI